MREGNQIFISQRNKKNFKTELNETCKSQEIKEELNWKNKKLKI